MANQLTIGEVAERSGVAQSTLRYYERELLIESLEIRRRPAPLPPGRPPPDRLHPRRPARGPHAWRRSSRPWHSLPSARTPTAADWKRLSQSWRPRLDPRIAELEHLRDRLDTCIGCGCLSLRVCRLSNPDDVAASLGSGPQWLLSDS